MIRIEPHSLWLGNSGDFRDVSTLVAAGIEAVVQLAIEEPLAPLPREIVYLRVPILDVNGNIPVTLRLSVDVVSRLLSANTRTLLCCSAGMSRSPAIAAFALAAAGAPSPEVALEAIRKTRAVDVSAGLWQELLAV